MTTLQQELDEQEKRQKDFLPAVKLVEGNNQMEITSDEVVSVESKYAGRGMQKVFRVLHEGAGKKLWLSERNPAFREILKLAKENGRLNAMRINVIRTGAGTDTRLVVKKI